MAKQTDPATERLGRDVSRPDELGRMYRALTTGSVDAARSLLSADVVLRVPGRSQVAGAYHGPESVAGYFRSLKELSGGSAAVTVTDVTQAAGRAVVLQTVTAERSARRLEDDQSVVLKLDAGRVAELRVHPNDLRGHDVFWGRASLLTPEDRDLLAAAIKAGSTPPPDPNARKRVLVWFAVAVIVFVASIVVFNWLNTHYSRQRLLATSTDLSSVQHVVMAEDTARGAWETGPTIVRGAEFSNPLGEVRVSLPLPQADCSDVATSLGTQCTSGVIPLDPPLRISSPEPVRMTGVAKQVSRLDVELNGASDVQGESRISFVTESLRSPSLCFSEPSRSTEFILSDADGRRVRAVARPRPLPIGCNGGVVLSIGDSRSQEQQTSVLLDGLSEARIDATGTFMDLDGLAGRLALVNVERHVFDDAAHVVSNASSGEPFLTELNIGEAESRLTVRSDEVASVVTDDGELLPTEWERLPQPLVALIGSLATALVLPALIAFLQLGRDRVLLGRSRPQ